MKEIVNVNKGFSSNDHQTSRLLPLQWIEVFFFFFLKKNPKKLVNWDKNILIKCPTPDWSLPHCSLTPFWDLKIYTGQLIDFLCRAGMLLTNNGMERMFVNIRWTLPVDFKTIDQGFFQYFCSPVVFAARRAAQI